MTNLEFRLIMEQEKDVYFLYYWNEDICGQCETVSVLVVFVAAIMASFLMITDNFCDRVLEG